MISSLYIEVNVLCIAVLLIMMAKVKHGVVREMEQIVFLNLCFNAMLLFLMDILWNLCNGLDFAWANPLNNILNAGFFSQTAVLGYCWLRYSYFLDDTAVYYEKGVRFYLFLVPMFLAIVVCVASIWTGWVFTVDEQNCYHRGPMLWLHVVFSISYMIFVFCRALYKAFKKGNFVYKDKFLAIASLGYLPVACEAVQLSFPGEAVFCVGTTFGLLIVFFENQNQMISLDPLTKMNNRVQMNRFLDSKMKANDFSKRLVLFIMDLDMFKHINDTYGHMEGDRALLLVSDVLKRCLGPKGHFLARFGGDEFVAVAELKDQVEAYEIRSEIEETVAEKASGLPYPLTLSIGFAEQNETKDSLPDLIARADKELYKVKKKKVKR
ncbi:GGDEF domain-containing protein [Fibrobacter sp.]|uniref:GGDEF domain-containing protein n=1 Tax=Fibrobacter sp. TaxID=35828 RepID=UPI00388D8A03